MLEKLLIPVTATIVACAPLTAFAQQSTNHGTFTGASDHITPGGVQVIKTADGGALVILDSNFSLDGAPDPRVGFGRDGKYVATSDVGKLENLTGLQTYVVPARINIDDFNEVYIWCTQFNVPLGIATLNRN